MPLIFERADIPASISGATAAEPPAVDHYERGEEEEIEGSTPAGHSSSSVRTHGASNNSRSSVSLTSTHYRGTAGRAQSRKPSSSSADGRSRNRIQQLSQNFDQLRSNSTDEFIIVGSDKNKKSTVVVPESAASSSILLPMFTEQYHRMTAGAGSIGSKRNTPTSTTDGGTGNYKHLQNSSSVESSENSNQAIPNENMSSTTTPRRRSTNSSNQNRKRSSHSSRRETQKNIMVVDDDPTSNSSNQIGGENRMMPHHPHSPPSPLLHNVERKITMTGNSAVATNLLKVPETTINFLPLNPAPLIISNNDNSKSQHQHNQNQQRTKDVEHENNFVNINNTNKLSNHHNIHNNNLRNSNSADMDFRARSSSTASNIANNILTGSQMNMRRLQQQHRATEVHRAAGVFLNDGHRRIDFILVYQSFGTTNSSSGSNHHHNQNSANHSHHNSQHVLAERQRQYFEKNLQQEGLVLELDPLDGGDEAGKLCFVKVHAPWAILCRTAEMLQMKMPIRNAELPDDSFSMPGGSGLGAGIGGGGGGGGFCDLLFDPFYAPWFQFNDTEKLLIGRQPTHVTAQFTRARIEQFLITETDAFFTSTQRIRIVYDIMQRAKCDPDNSKKRGLQWLLKNSVYLAAYPPHDGGTETRNLDTSEPTKWSQRQVLKHTWANFNRIFKPQPLNLVRAYFGEKVGFYFAWLGFYTQMLVFPSIVGVICFLYGIFSLQTNPLVLEMCDDHQRDYDLANKTMCPVCLLPNCRAWTLYDGCESALWNYRFDHESHVIMAVLTLLWATVFVELWKRKEAELACEWDAFDAEQEDEGMRPEFEARTQTLRVSPVTNEEEPYIPACRRVLWSLQSVAGLFLLIMCVIAALIALITVRISLYGLLRSFGEPWAKYQFEFASLIIHVLTFTIVMGLGWVYEKAAHRLTELECPRTQADYLSSYIWKVFVFEILNNFAPILYAALIRGRSSLPHDQSWLLEMCDPGGCLNEVVQAIAILLLARLLISNAAELGVPVLKSVLKTMRLGAAVNPEHDDEPTVVRNLPRWQKDYTLNETNLDGVYAEYLEMMVQFGYVTLFVAAFPLAPFICLLNNIVEIRIDATNFVTSFRRPLPSRVSGIRIWRRCLNILIKLSVLCNAAFLAFTSELIPKIVYRIWYSPDGSTYGYMKWTLAKVNTTDWYEFQYYEHGLNATECYYRDFRENNNNYGPSLIWWQVMVARLAFFIVFVIAFYFIQWLCDFLVPDVPQHIKLRVDRANFLAKQALYGQELRNSGNNSGTPSANLQNRQNSIFTMNNNAAGLIGGAAMTPPWSTNASANQFPQNQSNVQQHRHSSITGRTMLRTEIENVLTNRNINSNGDMFKDRLPEMGASSANGVLMSRNGIVSRGQQQERGGEEKLVVAGNAQKQQQMANSNYHHYQQTGTISTSATMPHMAELQRAATETTYV